MWSKENHTENSKRENAKKKAESVKTEQSVKTHFFEALPWLKSKNFEITKVAYTSVDHTQTISYFFDFFLRCGELNGGWKKIYSYVEIQIWHQLPLELYLAQ